MSNGKGGSRGGKAVDAPKKSAGKTPRAATPHPPQRQVNRTRASIVLYLRRVAAETIWSNCEDMEEWELMMADDAATLMDAIADAIELEADLDPDFTLTVLSDPQPRKAV